MDYAKIFASNMRKARHSIGMSQEELGEACELTRNHIGTIERGEHSPRLETMAAIAKALGILLPDMLKSDMKKPASS